MPCIYCMYHGSYPGIGVLWSISWSEVDLLSTQPVPTQSCIVLQTIARTILPGGREGGREGGNEGEREREGGR